MNDTVVVLANELALVAVLSLAVVVAPGLMIFTLNQQRIARQEAALSRSLNLSTGAQLALSEHNTDLALALEANRIPGPVSGTPQPFATVVIPSLPCASKCAILVAHRQDGGKVQTRGQTIVTATTTGGNRNSAMKGSFPVASLIEESYSLERAGDIGTALQRAGQALDKALNAAKPQAIAAAQVCVAYCELRLGHHDRARTLAEEALRHAAPQARPRADAWRILGDCAHEAGDLVAAETFYQQAIDLGRQLGSAYVLHRCLHSLSACVYIPRGQFELALAADQESLRLARDLDMRDEIWLPLVTLGWVYRVTGQYEQAQAIVEEMRSTVQPGSLAEGYFYCLSADLAQDSPDPKSALALYARARSIAEAVGDPGLGVELRLGLSRYHCTFPSTSAGRRGNASAALDWADDALAIASRAGSRDLQGWALIERGRAAWETGDSIAAERDFRAAIEGSTLLQANFDLARASLMLAALLHGQRHAKAGAAWLQAASQIAGGGYAFLLEQERALAFPLIAEYMGSDDPAVASVSSALLSHLARVPAPLHIVTLGRFEVRRGARAVPDHAWRRRRAGELFRLLLVSPGHSLSRDQVVEALWPEKSPHSTQALFYQATSALRRALEPDLPDKFPSRYLEVEEGQVILHLPPGSWIDFDAFEHHLQAQNWEASVAVYRGELFPGDRYADWAAALRERLNQEFIRAAQAVARQRLERHEFSTALEACRRVLALDPWQEEAVLLAMQACVALNDRAGAVRLYRELEHSLAEAFGIEPQAELQQFHRSLL
jgi:DNA-binding SARP family transcriptional activator